MISPSDRSPPIQTSPCACLWFDCDGMRAKWGNIMPIMQVIPLCDLWFWMASKFAIFCNGIASSLYQLYPKRSRQNESNIGVWSNMVPSWIICTMGQSPGRQVGRGGTQWDLKSTNIFVFFRFLPISVNYLCQFLKSHFCDLLCHFSLVFWCYRERGRDFLMYSFWGWKEGWECIEWLAGFVAWAPQRGTASHRMSLCKSSSNLSQSMVVSLVDGSSDLVVLLAVWCCLSTNAWKVQSLPQVEPGDEANLHETRPLTFLEDSFLFHTAMI
jgi:hypothetical protein